MRLELPYWFLTSTFTICFPHQTELPEGRGWDGLAHHCSHSLAYTWVLAQEMVTPSRWGPSLEILCTPLYCSKACDPPEGSITDHLVVGDVWEASGPRWSQRLCWSGQGWIQDQADHCLGVRGHPAGSPQALRGPTLGVWLPVQGLSPPPWKTRWLRRPQLETAPPCQSQ